MSQVVSVPPPGCTHSKPVQIGKTPMRHSLRRAIAWDRLRVGICVADDMGIARSGGVEDGFDGLLSLFQLDLLFTLFFSTYLLPLHRDWVSRTFVVRQILPALEYRGGFSQ